MITSPVWVKDDGGRAAAGFKGDPDATRDCVTRAIAIAAELPYLAVYEALHDIERTRRASKKRRRLSPRAGMWKQTYKPYIESLGFVWTPTMSVGSGCTVHLRADELPAGRLIVKCSKHLVAVIDGEIHDSHDPSRDGSSRCVYGIWSRP